MYFVLPDGRVVGGGIQLSWEKSLGPDIKLTRVDPPLTEDEMQDWVCWQDFRNRETGKTLLSECQVIELPQRSREEVMSEKLVCGECGGEGAHAIDDYLCVYCRYEGADFRCVGVTYGQEI